jgi:hypothetical protein
VSSKLTKEFNQRMIQSMGPIIGKTIRIQRYGNMLEITVRDKDGQSIVQWGREEVLDGNYLDMIIEPTAFNIQISD